MGLAIRHSDSIVDLSTMPGLSVHRETCSTAIAQLQGRAPEQMEGRFAAGHSAWIASIDGEPAAWGWVASRTADIGELGLTFSIPPRERYLWNFVTLPGYRGRGIYPRLLDAIVRSESAHADRFWIAYAPENMASAAGIRRAGFEPVAVLSFDASGKPALEAKGDLSARASALLGLPHASGSLAPCWRCVREGRAQVSACAGCTCDYQLAASGC